ncbi:UDP-glucose 4-epimerase GalE [Francisellaceae bacterium]|nr:UDP-glucose 4-epimerase GalE [Francisellaceae bacterium]
MSQILVTGGAGYIGSHMVLHLLHHGHEVIILDDLSTGKQKSITGGIFYKGSIENKELLKEIFNKHKISIVMHFAASIKVGESVINPNKYYLNNLKNTLILLDGMLQANIKKIIFSSTAAVYGEPNYTPIDTKHPKKPINPYGKSKSMIEDILADYLTANRIQYTIFRYFNAAGADPKTRIGFPKTSGHLIPQLMAAASGRMASFHLYGNNYNTDDGTCIRDYIHVSDIAQAHYLALINMQSNNGSHIYNLGNEKGYSVQQIIDTAIKITNKQIQVTISDKRPGDPATLIANSHEASNNIGWAPKNSTIDQIIFDAWKWECKMYNSTHKN